MNVAVVVLRRVLLQKTYTLLSVFWVLDMLCETARTHVFSRLGQVQKIDGMGGR